MSNTVTVCDELLGSSPIRWDLKIEEERLSVRELIRARIYQEVQDVELNVRKRVSLLIDTEGAVMQSEDICASGSLPGRIDWKSQVDKATKAYTDGRLLVLFGDRQTESLDEELAMSPGVQITFLKLVPLVGG